MKRKAIPGWYGGIPLQYSCLENPRDGGTWWAAIYGVAQSRTRLKRLIPSRDTQLTGLPYSDPVCLIFSKEA